ncbi:MAG TPA: transcription-repair coupling factor [Parachlamydiaceae bacterium]|nr:transcription-repair coupling factor [Parachlamydiaceae bacterium]
MFVEKSEKIKELESALKNGDSILIEKLWSTPKAYIAALALEATQKNLLILTGASQEEIRFFDNFTYFAKNQATDYPAWEALPSENIAPSPDIVGERYRVLNELKSKKGKVAIVSSLQAALQRVIPKEKFQSLYTTLKTGDTFSFNGLIQKLQEMGYSKEYIASDKGQFAVRGGIIDVFPVTSPDPFRIEFFGDEIESIRIFDPIGQKSVKMADSLQLTAAKELEMLDKEVHLSTLLDYLGENTLIIFDDLLSLEDRYASLKNMLGEPNKKFSSIEQFLSDIENFQKIFWSKQEIEALSEIKTGKHGGYYSESAPIRALSFEMFGRTFNAKRFVHPFEEALAYLIGDAEDDFIPTSDEIFYALGKLPENCRLIILSPTKLEESNFQKRLKDALVTLPKDTSFQIGYLSSGIAFLDTETLLFPLTELTKRYKIRRQKQRSTYHTTPTEIYDLSPGELIVHLNHGIGKFLGFEKKPNHLGILSEFFLIEYAESGKLYVPINQAYLITKYIGATEEIPRLHTIGGTRWKKAKEQTTKAILGYAKELLELQARREIKGGFIYPEDSEDVKIFEEMFPFEETEDQLAAIHDLKQDMKSKKSMDRLVCGDVGYGKTEVAIRAAFKAVIDGGHQVAVLVPTTILAMQHYETFVERMREFPINIAVVSRFKSAKEIKEAIDGTANGTVDILIGTHRLTSSDIQFKNLGLIVIDEEQRFGVKVKEHLKKMKADADCLTLSATPIPRTLYMSLIGARDMSVVSTPPQDRLPITTIITDHKDQTIKNAILRELARDGQVFIIHNRVETIFDVANKVQKLVPGASIAVAHGQMHADEIDTVFHAFKTGKADVLISTTIIESGIDIPNANTILIDRADRFGMADLYQMRGRVGRWNRRAYAYFLVPNSKTLPELSRKRLNALVDSSGYGGGMKIAMRDLELRGAGDILGVEQSGYVSSIGFHLYCKLLKRTVLALQRKIPAQITETKMEFSLDARIKEEYIDSSILRMEIYQRFGEAFSLSEIDAVFAEMEDRFGKADEPAMNLYYLSRLRIMASLHGISELKIDKITATAKILRNNKETEKKWLLKKYNTAKELEMQLKPLLEAL